MLTEHMNPTKCVIGTFCRILRNKNPARQDLRAADTSLLSGYFPCVCVRIPAEEKLWEERQE